MEDDPSNQSWVTIAENDAHVWDVLLLLQSLRRSFTTRNVTLLITDNVSPDLRSIFLNQFDFVININSDRFKNRNYTDQNQLKLHCWNLIEFNKCVYIDPHIFVQQNCDELFTLDELSAIVREDDNGLISSLFVFHPKTQTYMDLLQIEDSKTGTDVIKEFYGGDPSNYHRLSEEIYFVRSKKSKANSAKLLRSTSLKGINVKSQISIEPELETYLGSVLPCIKIVENILLQSNHASQFWQSDIDIDKEKVTSPMTRSPPQELADSIAVIGMSCRFPGANSSEEYWDFLCSGQDGITQFPSGRPIPKAGLTSETAYRNSKAGYLKCPIDEFDAEFFKISPREAESMSPQQRILLEVTWESLENSGVNPEDLRGSSKTSVFLGNWIQEYKKVVMPQDESLFEGYLGDGLCPTASRISYLLDLRGVSVAIESACSSSLTAIHTACESLKKRESDLAIACGVNILHEAFDPIRSPILSDDYKCRPFDKSANGFVRAEGCGVLVLKRFSDAWKNGDNILCAIRGSAMNNDGLSTSFGTPSIDGQVKVIKQALKNAKVHPTEVSFIEAHGTGTPVGDPIEFSALNETYSEGRLQTLVIGSCKSNIGHTEGAAGIAGAIKIILCMKNKFIPPNIHFEEINPKINLNLIPCEIPSVKIPWNSSKRIAGLSSFGFCGNNVHMIIQEAPSLYSHCLDTCNNTQIITISAKSKSALYSVRSRYISFLTNSNINLKNISFTANTGRAHFQYRSAVCVNTVNELCTHLKSENYEIAHCPDAMSHNIGFLFTGQGCQYVGMAIELWEHSTEFRKHFSRCDIIFHQKFGFSMLDVCKNANLLEKNIYSMPTAFSIQCCISKVWAHFGIRPNYVIGHSFGEVAAAECAGILSLEDAMYLVIERSILLDTIGPGAMLVIRSNYDSVFLLIQKFLEKESNMWIDIAAVNSSEQVVVSAKSEFVKQFEEFCASHSVQTKKIDGNYAFHSRDMDKILDKYKEKLVKIEHSSTNCVYVSSVLGEVMKGEDFNVEYWLNHLRNTVNFSDAINLVTQNCKIMIEVGTHPILLPLAMTSINPVNDKVFCPSLRRNEKDLDCLCHSLKKLYMSGVQINWKAWHGDNKKYARVPLPNTVFERKTFWVKHVSRQTSGMNAGSKLKHQLLGYAIPSPSLEKTFHCTMGSTNFPWLEDHKIGECTVVPGAVYLEIITAAGKLALLGSVYSKVHVTVEHFAIYTALLMISESQIHTIVSSNYDGSKEGEVKVSVFSLEICRGYENWTKHADAIVSNKELAHFSNINIDSIISNLNSNENISNIYIKLRAHGYNFGPYFQSIKSIWMDSYEALAEIQLPDDIKGYICHPVILDAMLQTVVIHSNTKTLKVGEVLIPVFIEQYIWLGEEMSAIMYCHFAKGNSTIYLYSESCQLLAYIKNLEWISTTLESVEQTLKTSSVHIPKFYIDTWVPGAQKSIVDATLFSTSSEASQETCKSILLANTLVSEDLSIGITEKISLAYLIRAIQECNLLWTLNEHTDSILNDWKAKLLSSPDKYKLVEAYLDILYKHDYINANSYIIKALPSIAECNKIIEQLTFKMKTSNSKEKIELAQAEFDLVSKCGNQLTSVLKGKVTGLSVLFPQDGIEGAKEYYTKSKQTFILIDVLSSVFIDYITQLRNQGNHSVRILEIGGGTGSGSVKIHHRLSELKIPNTFVFTDISPYFVETAKLNFGSKFQYQILNIENDPLSQGFSPHSFDVIIGFSVVHATQSLSQCLEHLKMLIKPGGTLILGEVFKQTVSDIITWGLLDGWWRFNDFRKLSPLIDSGEWNKLLLNTGFCEIQTIDVIQSHYGCIVANSTTGLRPSMNATKTWLAICDVNIQNMYKLAEHFISLNRNLIPVRTSYCEESTQTYQIQYLKKSVPEFITLFEDLKHLEIEGVLCLFESSNNQFDIENVQIKLCGTLLHLTQAMYKYFDSTLTKPRLICVTRGVHYIGDTVCSDPSMGTVWGFLKVFANENPSYIIKLIDLDQNNSFGLSESEMNDIISQLWELDEERFLVFRNGQLFVQRFKTMPEPSKSLYIPSTPRFMLNAPESNQIDDISVVSTKNLVLKPNEVEIEVRASALNFRDLLVILKPDVFSLSQHDSAGFGIEISGKISSVGSQVTNWKIGDEIFGCCFINGFASHVILPETQLIHKPKDMSFVRAAAFPVAFSTAYVSLVEIATLSRVDNVLIHAAAGGVGIACIQIAKQIGATIFVTAGSHRKREYLRSLGLKYIYNSRNTDYKEFILKDTNGVGVDVVVNSLTTDTFKNSTLDVCAKNARFVEISKLNIWTTEEMMSLRPDICYTIVDFVITSGSRPTFIRAICTRILDTFPCDCYTKIPITVFSFEKIKEALKHMKDAKHIGKIVVQLPRCSRNMLGIGTILKYDYFDKYSTYLITGGLGGIGLEVMKWMLSVGAHHIVLTSRNPPNENCVDILNSVNESKYGNVVVIHADIGIYSECITLLEKIKNGGFPSLRGIMHAAGTLDDGMIPNQSWEKFTSVFKAKVYGGWYLHCLTKDYCLDHFVMFSSAVCTFGSPGQSNHSAANYYLDSLAHYRNSIGLVGSTINWGAWSDVGAMTRQPNQFGIRKILETFNSKDGIAGLEKFISNKNIQSVICNLADLNLIDNDLKLGNFLKEVITQSMNIDNSSLSPEFKQQNIKNTFFFDGTESIETIELYVEKILKEILGVYSHERIFLDKSFSNLGLDSLMTMEFRNKLQTVLPGKFLPINVFSGVSTIKTLSKDILYILIMESKIERRISLNFDLIKYDSILPVQIKSGNISPNFKFKNIFLTGSTGFLGSHFLSKISQTKFKIYCLIRCKSNEEGLDKLIMCLKKHQILNLTNFENISILSGDLTTEYFGLSSEEYFRLATNIDLIIHSAAKVNHIEHYEDNGDLNNLRSQHLNSMINILKFAGTNKTKIIFYTSSTSACTKVTIDKFLSEEYPDEDEYGQNLLFGTQGYGICKLVSEKLISQAEERGIPCIVMRYPSLLGSNRSKIVTAEKDHLWVFFLSFLAIKKIPLLYPSYPFIPVDIAVEISMSILLNDKVEMGVYNLTPHTVVTNEILQEIMIQKFDMKDTIIVPYSEWRKELFELPKDLNPLLHFEYLYDEVIEGSGEHYTKYHDHLTQIKFDELSEKVIRNFPNVKNIMVESKYFLEQCIRNYLLKRVT